MPMQISDEQLREAMKHDLERRARAISAYPPETFGAIQSWEWVLAVALCVGLPLLVVFLCA